ncbi:MAG: extracellular solute-binding protein [Butyrivibrio sp.]|uniref:ABC transporter substrate-binding protein n=1 Tax=Butyrivibrio sp. TaxID=28121 RepID=UPI001B259264|nr:extracellular solute-binding protein [Butyrivibrio sp.]MBO6242048.1 extracellular solute-binding protein [Butyrivibrio sp.]
MDGERLKKTFVSIVLDIALILSVFLGCGDNSPQPVTDEQIVEDTMDSKNMEEAEIIRVATWYDDSYTSNLRTYLVHRFPYYKFEFVYIDKAHYESIIDAQLSFKGAPDIIYVNQNMARKNAKNGYIIPLTAYCSNFDTEALDAFWYDKDTYAVPGTTCFECMYINKDLFDKYGMKVPKNTQEFIAMCDFMIRGKRMKALSAGFMDYQTVSNSAQSVLQANYFGTEYGSGFGARLNYSRSVFYNDLFEPLKDWEQMIKHGIITADMYNMDKQAAIKEFVSGESFMLVAGPEDYNRIRVANPDMELGTLPMGWGRYGPLIIGGCNLGFAVNANAMNLEGAKEVVAALSNNEGQFAIWKDRVGSRTYLRGTNFDNPEAFEGIEDAFDTNQVFLPVLEWGEDGPGMNVIFGKELQQVIVGKKPLNMALMETDIQINAMKNR